MKWWEVSDAYQARTLPHDCRLDSLPHEWQREIAALWRVEADVNNGAYLQFLGNWGRESYVYASQALKKIGARRMAQIVDACQALIDERLEHRGERLTELREILPEEIVARIYDLSYEFMDYPDDVETLAMAFYRSQFEPDLGLS